MCPECKARLAEIEANPSSVVSMWEFPVLYGCVGSDDVDEHVEKVEGEQ